MRRGYKRFPSVEQHAKLGNCSLSPRLSRVSVPLITLKPASVCQNMAAFMSVPKPTKAELVSRAGT